VPACPDGKLAGLTAMAGQETLTVSVAVAVALRLSVTVTVTV
jgi:hypothetical protein